jgi:hypothetical protein
MTPTLIKEMFPEFVSKSDAFVQIFIDQAALSVNVNIWLAKTEVGIAYLTAHLIALSLAGSQGASGNVTSEKVGDLSHNYANNVIANATEYHDSKYGAEFYRLRKTLPITPFVL